MGRDFRLILTPKRGVLHSKFKAYSVDGDGNETSVHLDHDSFYDGRVFGELNSAASLHIDDEGVMTGTVHLPDETYHIEVGGTFLSFLLGIVEILESDVETYAKFL